MPATYSEISHIRMRLHFQNPLKVKWVGCGNKDNVGSVKIVDY